MKRTPLFEENVRLGGKMVEFGGWEMPLNFPTGIIAEHLADRKFGGIFDISHMGRFRITGSSALPFLQYVLTNSAAAIQPGQAQYTMIPTPIGGAVDDAYLYRLGEDEYLLVVNAANTEKDWKWFTACRSKYPGLILEDHTDEVAMISIQGPESKAVMSEIIDCDDYLPEPARNYLTVETILGKKTPVSRTGYTGDPVGFEIFPPREIAVELYRLLIELGRKRGIVPAGLGARDTLRLEAGLPLYGHELGADIYGREIPVFALPIARLAVSFAGTKGDYIGREALRRQFEEVKLRFELLLDTPRDGQLVPRTVMPIEVTGGIARAGAPVYNIGKPAGYVTSGTAVPYWVPVGSGAETRYGEDYHTRAIALAFIDSDIRPGERVKIVIRDREASGLVVKRNLSGQAPPYARPIFWEESKILAAV